MVEEEWRDVTEEDFSDIYQVSSLGRVRNKISGKLKQSTVIPNGYERIMLYNKDKRKYCMTHRLIAQAFIPNPNQFPQVNHLNEIKTDNRVENLEWTTAKDNHNYGTRNRRAGISKLHGKKIYCIETGEVFDTFVDITAKYNIPRQSMCDSCKSCGKWSAYGYHFRYIS